MKIRNPFSSLSKFELLLWIISLLTITVSFFFSEDFNFLTLTASLIGVTALIFVAKGDVFGQILAVFFSLIYAVISFQFKYYGEMITYLGMTAPIAVLSTISWIKNPYKDTSEVKINHLHKKQIIALIFITIIVTFVFYFILKFFNTANLFISTISIATSFSASALMLLRSPIYALAYATNDIILIVLWILATIYSLSYLPMVICFLMFLINDIYGFINWTKIKKRQSSH